MQRIILFVLLVFIVGCSWASQTSYKGRASLGLTKDELVVNDTSVLKGAGIVLGRVVRENITGGFADYIDRLVIFKNLTTGREFEYYDGDYFFLKLIEGEYEIIGFETRMGITLRSINDGFKFKVRNGEITYIGNITGEKAFKRSGKIQSLGITTKVFVSGPYSGGASLFIPRANYNYTFHVIDDKKELLQQFNCLFPNLSSIGVKTDLMK